MNKTKWLAQNAMNLPNSNLHLTRTEPNSAPHRLELTCIDGAKVVDGFLLKSFPAIVGRAPDADATINNHWISRKHCRIDCENGAFVVDDLGSRNGTYLNMDRVSRAELQSGDRLSIGMSTFLVMIHSEDMPSTIHWPPQPSTGRSA